MRRLNRQAWLAVAQACIIALLISCDSTAPTDKTIDPPEAQKGLVLEAQSDTTLTGTVGVPISPAPIVRLTLDGKPAPGREVRFSVSGGGSAKVTLQRTDTAGLASPGGWTLGTVTQPQTLTAHATGAVDLVFRVTPKAGAPAAFDVVAGNHQAAAAGAPLPVPLQVKLADQYGNPVPDAPVSYAILLGDGSLPSLSTRTDSSGVASSGTWTLGSAGAQLVRISAAGRQLFLDAFACDERCRGRDFLFTSGSDLISVVDGVATSLYTHPSAGEIESWISSPAWSPNGQKVAFTVWQYDWITDESHAALYLMDADGSNVVLREDGFTSASWSPDGLQLAATGPDGVYVMSAEPEGAQPVLLARGATAPAWSPDGAAIAFVEVAGDPVFEYAGSLKLMHADGTPISTILSEAGATFGGPTWSPDGQWLAFIKSGESGSTLFTVSANGGNPVELSPVVNASVPAWSPDGSRIAFVSLSASGAGIMWLPADGSSSTPIPLIAHGSNPAWHP